MEPQTLPQRSSDWTAPQVLAHCIRIIEEQDRRLLQMIADQQALFGSLRKADKEAFAAAMLANREAVAKAEAGAEQWRASANEWRDAMDDKDRQLPTRNEVSEMMRNVESQVAQLSLVINRHQTWIDQSGGKERGRSDVVGWIVGAVGFLIGLASFAINLFVRGGGP